MEKTLNPFLPPVLDYVLDFLARASQSSVLELRGSGQTSQGHGFEASMTLSPIVGRLGCEIDFSAADDEAAFHIEKTWIAEDLLQQRLQLWTLSKNTPGVLAHRLVTDEVNELGGSRERRLVFRLGEADDMSRFRQEITLDFHRDGSLEYRYSWGIPHEALEPRVRAHLHRTAPAISAKETP
jgi:hypothetical protein